MIRLLSPSPALLIEGKNKLLVVADLHLGFEFALANKGINIPSQMPKMRDELIRLIERHQPDVLMILGDVKHGVPKISLQEWGDVPELFNTIKGKVREIRILRGNHDGRIDLLIPKDIKIYPSSGASVDDSVGLFHGHAWPNPRLLGCRFLITAHTHPTVSIRTSFGFRIVRRVWIKTTCNGEELAKLWLRRQGLKPREDVATFFRHRFNVSPRKRIELFLVPAFNEILGGVAVNKKPSGLIGPIFRSGTVNVENAELYLLDGTFLGAIKRLRSLV